MKLVFKFIPIFLLISLVGCSNMSTTEQRVLSGAAIGAGAGALIDGGQGALIGAGVGALGGAIYDSTQDY